MNQSKDFKWKRKSPSLIPMHSHHVNILNDCFKLTVLLIDLSKLRQANVVWETLFRQIFIIMSKIYKVHYKKHNFCRFVVPRLVIFSKTYNCLPIGRSSACQKFTTFTFGNTCFPMGISLSCQIFTELSFRNLTDKCVVPHLVQR